jgi:HSP20 family protein
MPCAEAIDVGNVCRHQQRFGSTGKRAALVGPNGSQFRRPATSASLSAMMNQIVNWDPFQELENMHRRLSSLMSDNGRSRRSGNGRESMMVSEWAPVVDISEDEKSYVIKAELPEVKKEDVHVTVENGVLTLSGERKFEKEEKGRKHHRIERSYGTFVRSFALPDNIDATKVNATYKDGLLTVSVAKSENAKPKQIEVKVA